MKNTKLFSKLTIIIISFVLLLPAVMLLLYSFFEDFTGIVPRGFTIQYYIQAFTEPRVLLAIMRTIVISIIPTFISLFVLLLAMYAIEVKFKWLEKYIKILMTIPYAIQGVILAVSLIGIYIGKGGILSNRFILLISAYCVIILPYMYQGIRNAMDTVNMKVLMEAAQVLGASKFFAYSRIIIPSMKEGILVSCFLCLGIIFSDFVLVNILAGSHYETISIYLRKLTIKSGQASSVISVLMFVVMIMISTVVLKKEKGK